MKQAIRGIGAAVALLVVLGAPAAAEEEDVAGRGFYGNLGAVWSLAAFDVPAAVGQQDSWGLDARVGYRVHPNLGLEAQYQWAARHELTGGGAQLNVVETNAGTGNARIFLLSGPLQPYVLLGVGVVHAALERGDDKLEAAFRGGGGFQVFFTDHIGAYAELTYLKPFTSLGDFNTVPIAFGGAYRF
jgi:hypothetical protein